MSSNVVESLAPPAGPKAHRSAPPAPAPAGGVAAAAVLAPAIAALAAFAVHQFLPDRQRLPFTWMDDPPLPAWQHPYPIALAVVVAAGLLTVAAQWAWRPLRPAVRFYAPLAAGAIVLVALWELITLKLNWLRMPFFPGPDLIIGALIEDRELLALSTWYSLRLLMTGYAAGVAAGLVSGVLIGWNARARYWGMPVLRVFGPVPATALIPLAMSLSSDALASGAALIAFPVWFSVTMLTYFGVANVRLSHLDVARTLGAGRLYLIFRVAVPSALPSIFLGLFMGLGAAFLTLTAAETIGVKAGLGWYVQWRKGNGDYSQVYAALVIMAAFFSTIMTLLFKVRDWMLRWQKGVIKW